MGRLGKAPVETPGLSFCGPSAMVGPEQPSGEAITMTATLEARLEQLERRLREVEDRQEIMQLIATYGPAADTCTQAAIADLWTDDGTYTVVGHSTFEGSKHIGTLVEGASHQGYVSAGCSHVMAMPHIVVDGDTAVATGYSQVFVRDGDHWRVARASGNRWELVRTPAGWRVKARYNHLMDGSESSRALMAQALPQALPHPG